jgi:hypothetical protein
MAVRKKKAIEEFSIDAVLRGLHETIDDLGGFKYIKSQMEADPVFARQVLRDYVALAKMAADRDAKAKPSEKDTHQFVIQGLNGKIEEESEKKITDHEVRIKGFN